MSSSLVVLGPRTTVGIAAGLVASLFVCGCGVNRFDHLHDDANAQKAKEASDLFEAVRSKRTGLPARMLANLEAEKALRTTVAGASIQFASQVNLQQLESMPWKTLYRDLRSQLGYRTDSTADGLMDILANLDAVPQNRRADIQKRATTIAIAIARLDAVFPSQDNPYGLRDSVNDSVAALNKDYEAQNPKSPPVELNFTNRLKAARDHMISITERDFKDVLGWSRADLERRLQRADPEVREEKANILLAKSDGSEFAAYLERLQNDGQIERRLKLLAQSVSVYEVLVTGERARMAMFKKAQKDLVERAKKTFPASPSAPTSPSTDTTNPDTEATINLLFFVHDTLNNYWTNEEHRANYLRTASELQRLLLKTADQSRDPAGVYSLVPLTGSGLSDDELKELESYINALKDQFTGEKAKAFEKELAKAIEDDETERSAKVKQAGGNEKAQQDEKGKVTALTEFRDAWDHLKKAMGDKPPSLVEILKDVVKASDALSLDLDVLHSKRRPSMQRNSTPP
ncbi:MAG: hypothetical protein QM783_12420 [Phycisphaerales bacterium]